MYWSFEEGAASTGISNPVIRTGGVLDHWKKAGGAGVTRILPDEIMRDSSLLKPGLIFVMSTGGGKGHMGLVEDFRDDRLITIEGNTNQPGDREGIGVFRRTGAEDLRDKQRLYQLPLVGGTYHHERSNAGSDPHTV